MTLADWPGGRLAGYRGAGGGQVDGGRPAGPAVRPRRARPRRSPDQARPMTPTLVVVSGPPGSGKTTLAHQIAAAVGCPVISRDEIKQGMAHAAPGFTGAPGDELTRRTFPVFFAVLDLLLRSGVTTVAEAAF